MKGMTNAAVDTDVYRYVGKDVVIEMGGYKTFTKSSTINGRLLYETELLGNTVEEVEGKYGYYQGRKSYTTLDTIQANINVDYVGSASSAYPVTFNDSLADDEYFIGAYARVSSSYKGAIPINDVIGLGGYADGPIPTDARNIGTLKYHQVRSSDPLSYSTAEIFATKATNWIRAKSDGSVQLRCWKITFNDFDFGYVLESGGGGTN